MHASSEFPDVSPLPPRTIWTRGEGCAELAKALAGDGAVRAVGDLLKACVEARAELLVTKRVPQSAPVASATPVDFAPEGAASVVALVSGGPHSVLAARVANWLGQSLHVPAELVSGFRVPDEQHNAQEVLERIGPQVPSLSTRVVEAWTARQLLGEMDDDALLVFGAAGGSWIQRMFLGPGARLASSAPVGAIVVRDEAARVFQMMREPVYVSPLLGAADAILVSDLSTVPVVTFGRLVGVVQREVLEASGPTVAVEALMQAPLSVAPGDEALAVAEISRATGMDPIPVCNPDDLLVGVVSVFA